MRTAVLAILLVTAPALASAQDEGVSASENRSGFGGFLDRHGVSVTAGLGINEFANTRARDFIGPGASYTVRVLVGTRARVGYELAYMGSAAGIQALGLQQGAVLLSNGVEAAVRLNLTETRSWQPYLLTGAAWRHFAITRAAFNQSSANDSDNVLEVPLAAGLAWKSNTGLVVDARFAYRLSAGADLLGGPTGGGPALDNWNLGLKVGWAF